MANLVFDFLHNYVTGERRASDPADAYQYDEGHVLEAVVPVAVASCEIQYWIRGMEKADAYTPTSITQNTDNTYTILGNIPNSYFETNGDLRVYIVVTDGNASITTYEGYIHIKERQMPEDYVDDDPDNDAVQIIAAARGYAETSEAWAVGQINGEDVPSTADQYQNNASYYADQAASAASSAAAQASLAPAYDNTATYAVGDYCLHDGQLYECTTAITTAEAWTAAHWTAVTVGGELSNLKDDYTTILDSAYVTDTASGAIASFPDGADNVPVKSLTVEIEPVQSGSGDPSPDNVRPLSGHTSAVVFRCGFNVWDEEWEGGWISTSTGANQNANDALRSKNYVPVIGGKSYHITTAYTASNQRPYLHWYDANKNWIGYKSAELGEHSITATLPDNARFLRFSVANLSTPVTYNHDISINYPSTDHDYHAYNGQTVTIDLDGTIYGGTLNVGTGVLTVDKAIWDFNASVDAGGYGMPFSAFLPNNVKMTTSSTVLSGTICNQLMEVKQVSSWGINGTFSRTANSTRIYFKINDDVTTIESLNEYLALHPLQFAYPIANPFTVQLTANEISTLLGQNNIWSDAGTVDVTYRADTKLYIEKLTAPTEDDMIADHAISANSFFMVGNTLYRATTAIASGATITVGTNATKMSLSEALNALS